MLAYYIPTGILAIFTQLIILHELELKRLSNDARKEYIKSQRGKVENTKRTFKQ